MPTIIFTLRELNLLSQELDRSGDISYTKDVINETIGDCFTHNVKTAEFLDSLTMRRLKRLCPLLEKQTKIRLRELFSIPVL